MGNFVVIWYIFTTYGYLYQEKSGSPGPIPYGVLRQENPVSCKRALDLYQGCQMVYFQTNKSQFGQILEGLR
jgi:hypothetical protein